MRTQRSIGRRVVWVACALECWYASGARTADRLDSLVKDYAGSYGITDPADVAEYQVEARAVAGLPVAS